MRYWLMKSEPSDVSIDDLANLPDQTVAWYGVRNYQARNFMRDQMKIGDGVLFYHSNCKEPGIVGIARVSSTPIPMPRNSNGQANTSTPRPRRKLLAGSMWMYNWSGRLHSSQSMSCANILSLIVCALCNAATGCRSRRLILPSGSL
jgi:hypothetical protein